MTGLAPDVPVRDAVSTEPWSALSLEDIPRQLEALDQPRYRARQLYEALHRNGAWSWPAITTWPASIRERAASRPLRSLVLRTDLRSRHDGTRKVLFETWDRQHLEAVLMRSGSPKARRYTVCVSSQVGCPAACSFCASGLAGFTRNLTATEIADQVEFFAGELRLEGQRITNVVYMGMGEPFLNYRRVVDSINHLRSSRALGLGSRRITVSTVGIIPGIRRFAHEPGEVNLAISLHAPNDQLRSELVPYNRQFPLEAILDAVREYTTLTHRRVSFEYVLLRNTNDDPGLALELVSLLRPLRTHAHVNLIPWNPFGEVEFHRAGNTRVTAFAEVLEREGVPVTVRYSKGLDINAACGQLRDRTLATATAS